LRIQKTRAALFAALLNRLHHQKFIDITVSDILKDSLVNKAAFYARFKNKNDLLEQFLYDYKPFLDRFYQVSSNKKITEELHRFMKTHYVAVINLLEDADPQQIDLLLRFLSPQLTIANK